MKKCLAWGLVLCVALVLQSTVFAVINYKSVHADLLLVVVISSSLLLGREHGVVVGFFAGLLQDLLSGTFFGMNILSKMVLGYVFGIAEEKVFKEYGLLPIAAMFVATVANGWLTGIIMVLLGYRFDLVNSIVYVLLPVTLFNMVLAYPVHRIVYKISALLKD